MLQPGHSRPGSATPLGPLTMIKFLSAQMPVVFQKHSTRGNARTVVKLILVLLALVIIYSVLFHFIMAWEDKAFGLDRHYSWVTGFYWTLVVMSTLGFGDITFASDLGRLFSIVVLLTGVIFLLILLPFSFIQFLYLPWIEAQQAARTPRELDESLSKHVLLTHDDPVSRALMNRLEQRGIPFALLVADAEHAGVLHDEGLSVMIGPLDQPDTYRRARLESASLLFASGSDPENAAVAFNARDVAPTIPIVASATEVASIGVLKVAGCTRVLRLGEILGQALARRTIGGDAMTHEIGRLDEVIIAEASCVRTPLVGKTLRENKLNELGVNVVGIWDRGNFEAAGPDTMIGPNTVLVLAGTKDQLLNYDEHFAIYNVAGAPSIVIGAGRVGSAAVRALSARGVAIRIIEKNRRRAAADNVITGNAADEAVLAKAGIKDAPSAIITTSDDAVNIYLTIMIRHLRPDIQIVSRSVQDHTVDTLHRAGADFVVSEASMGASMTINLMDRSELLMLAEGLDISRLTLPTSLVGRTLAEAQIRRETGCTVIGLTVNGQTTVNPDPHTPLPADAGVILIGSAEAERCFIETFGRG